METHMKSKLRTPIGLGIAGLGRAGWDSFVRELATRKNKFRIVAACDVVPQRRELAARQFGCATYERVEDMVADPHVELLAVATRSDFHFPHAVLGLKAGKCVFLEKPITVDYAQARKLQAIAARSKGKLFVRHNSRYNPVYRQVQQVVESGILGEVFEIKIRWMAYVRRDDWQTMRRYGGGIMANTGTHIVDQALQLLGSPVKDIWCDLHRVAAVGDAEDHMRLMLRGRNGRLIDLEHSSGAAVREDPDWTVLGTRGGLVCRKGVSKLTYLDPRRKLDTRQVIHGAAGHTYGTAEELPWIEKTLPGGPPHGGSSTIWDDLHAAIRKGKKYPITIEQAVEVIRVLSVARKQTAFP
jgi:predicted dehydrogenase